MKIKKEYIILAIIITALSVYLVMRRGDRTLYQLPEIAHVAQKEITKLQITKGKTVIVLNKKDNNWYIAPREYPADPDKVGNMLDNIEKLTLTALVSESKNYNLYDLGQEVKINVKAWQGDSLKRDVDVGKTASSFRHTFVKPAGDDRVFHARGNFRNTFNVAVDDLRDKTVLTFKPADIQQIQLTKDQQTLVLTRTQATTEEESQAADKKESASPPAQKTFWQTTDGRSGDESALNQLLSTLSNLRCEKFIDDRKKEDFADPLYILQLKGAQGYSLAIFAKAEEKGTDYPAISSASGYPFVLSDNQVNRIIKNPSEFLKLPETDEKKSEPQKPESNQQKE